MYCVVKILKGCSSVTKVRFSQGREHPDILPEEQGTLQSVREMVQGYKAQGGGSVCFRPSLAAGSGEVKGDRPAEGRDCPGGAHTGGPERKQRLHLRQGNLSYADLKRPVEKLEDLC